MLAFLLILTVILLAATLWSVFGGRKQRKSVAVPLSQRPRTAHAQSRVLDIPSHLNEPEFAQLLRAAKGDRSIVENWILTEQRRHPTLDRNSATERIAARFNQARSG